MTPGDDRPLTARGVLASALLGLDPPEASVARLIQLAELFDMNENRARVALSRMVAAGEATTDGNGRYRLEGRLLERQARQRRSHEGATAPWSGSWQIVISTEALATSAARARRRRALVDARLGELREGVWLRPDNLPVELGTELDSDGHRFTGTVDADPADLAKRLWDLDHWSRHAAQLIGRLEVLDPGDRGRLADGFVLSASVLRHLQADPLLPPELLPENWPGPALRVRYRGWDRQYRQQLANWYRGASGPG